jgi:glycosyltransferase involved in cell wall biosynthesis
VIRSIDINARFLTQPITGVQRFAVEIVAGIDRHLSASAQFRDQYRFRLISPRSARTMDLEHIPLARAGRLEGHGWEQLELPLHARGRVLLNLCNTAPVFSRNVVTIHDAAAFAVPEAYSRAFRLWYRALIPALGRGGLQVVTVSEFSREELSLRARIPKHKLAVISEGCEHILRVPPDHGVFARVPVRPRGYVLAVGSRSPHKNLGVLAAALRRLDAAALPFVIAGGVNARVFGNHDAAAGDGIHHTGYVTDGELRALYENACCFLYPSLYEGFGIPPLEAMTCGAPVIASHAASLPEVCGDAAVYCDPRDPADWARTLGLLIQDPTRQGELRRRGLERARGFTWERASTAMLDILDRVHRP